MARDISQAVQIIMKFEGIKDGDPSTVNLNPYLCPAGYWTIGWGHVVIDSHGNLVKGMVNKPIAYAVYPDGITEEEAKVLLQDDVRKFARGVDSLVETEVNDTRFCALISFAFNVGIGAFKNSTLLKLLNQGKTNEVPIQLKRWIKSDGIELPGLKKRREAEAALWESASL